MQIIEAKASNFTPTGNGVLSECGMRSNDSIKERALALADRMGLNRKDETGFVDIIVNSILNGTIPLDSVVKFLLTARIDTQEIRYLLPSTVHDTDARHYFTCALYWFFHEHAGSPLCERVRTRVKSGLFKGSDCYRVNPDYDLLEALGVFEADSIHTEDTRTSELNPGWDWV